MVTDVQIEGLGSTSRTEILDLLGIKKGAETDDGKISEGIKRAFLKGAFDDITVEAPDEAPGKLIIKVREKDVIDSIKVTGNRKVKDSFVLKALGYKEDDYLQYEDLEKKRAALVAALAYGGYPSADAQIKVERLRKPYRVRLVVLVSEGKPLMIKSIEFPGLPKTIARPSLGVSAGDVYDRYALDAGIVKLKAKYKDDGYLKPAVGPYEFSEGVLRVNDDPGPKLKIALNGNSVLSNKDILAKLPFFDVGEINDGLIAEGVDNIMDLYREKGYVKAQVAPVLDRADGLITFHMFIHEGGKVTVKSIEFQGNSLPAAKLMQIMTLQSGGPYDPAALKSSIQALIEFYRSLGYVAAAVAEPSVTIVNDSAASILIKITEGGKYVISRVEVEGATSIPVADVRKQIGIKDGAQYNEVDIADARRRVISLYRGKGFVNCSIDVTRSAETDLSYLITFKVKEGERFTFGHTIVSGNRTVRYRVIERELTYAEGETFNPDSITATRRALYKLGLFSDLQFTTEPAGDHRMDVLINAVEDEAGSVEVSVGYGEYERYRGAVDISYRNLFGMNRTLSFIAYADTLSNKYTLKYYEPWVFDHKLPLTASVSTEKTTFKNIDTGRTNYKLDRQIAELSTERSLSEHLKWSLAYDFTLVKTYDVQKDIILTRDDTGTVAISGFTPALTFDTRDNPFNPKSGVFAGLSLKGTSSAFLSQADFVKTIAHLNAYQSLARWLVLAGSVRGGIAESFDKSKALPLVERFFLGGRDTVRGYAQDTLGPRGKNGDPTGGDAYVCGNLELRWLVYGNWSITTFVDAGNVWVQSGGTNPWDLRYTTGGGIEYGTPVGPLRVEYGYKLNKRPGESPGELHFSIGYAF